MPDDEIAVASGSQALEVPFFHRCSLWLLKKCGSDLWQLSTCAISMAPKQDKQQKCKAMAKEAAKKASKRSGARTDEQKKAQAANKKEKRAAEKQRRLQLLAQCDGDTEKAKLPENQIRFFKECLNTEENKTKGWRTRCHHLSDRARETEGLLADLLHKPGEDLAQDVPPRDVGPADFESSSNWTTSGEELESSTSKDEFHLWLQKLKEDGDDEDDEEDEDWEPNPVIDEATEISQPDDRSAITNNQPPELRVWLPHCSKASCERLTLQKTKPPRTKPFVVFKSECSE